MKKLMQTVALSCALIAMLANQAVAGLDFGPLVVKPDGKYLIMEDTDWNATSAQGGITFDSTVRPEIYYWPSFQTIDMMPDADPSGYYGFNAANDLTTDYKLKTFQNMGFSVKIIDDSNSFDSYGDAIEAAPQVIQLLTVPKMFARTHWLTVHKQTNVKLLPLLGAQWDSQMRRGADGKSAYQHQVEFYQWKFKQNPETPFKWDGVRVTMLAYGGAVMHPLNSYDADTGERLDKWKLVEEQMSEISSVTGRPYNIDLDVRHMHGFLDDQRNLQVTPGTTSAVVKGGDYSERPTVTWVDRDNPKAGHFRTYTTSSDERIEATTLTWASPGRGRGEDGCFDHWGCNGIPAWDVSTADEGGVFGSTFLRQWNWVKANSPMIVFMHQFLEIFEQGGGAPSAQTSADIASTNLWGDSRINFISPLAKAYLASHNMPIVPFSDVPIAPVVLQIIPAPAINGWLDQVRKDGFFSGWTPEADQRIMFYDGPANAGGVYQTSVVAWQYRSDVTAGSEVMNVPGKDHGFSSDELDLSGLKGLHTFYAYAVTADGNAMYLLNGQRQVDFGGTVVTPPLLPLVLSPEEKGWHDQTLSNGFTSGWHIVADGELRFYDGSPYTGGKWLGTTNASQFRSDVNQVIGLTGNHGFSYELNLSGNHTIYVYGVNAAKTGMYLLNGSPKVIGSGTPTPTPVPTATPTPTATPKEVDNKY